MIILITGPSHAGKTLLAQRLLEKLKFPYFSIDHLKMGLIRSNNTRLTPEDDDELTEYLWPIVREMVKTAIENNQNLIVEGCYIPATWRKDFEKSYLDEIRFICLCMTDEYIENHFDKIQSQANIIENRLDDSYCTVNVLKQQNQLFRKTFEAAGELVFLIEENYEKEINKIFQSF